MTNHLSQEQIAKAALGQIANAERRHLAECLDCKAELESLGDALSLFRGSIRHRIDDRIGMQTPPAMRFPVERRHAAWRWALVAAAIVVVIVLPFVVTENQPQKAVEQVSTQADADEIMRRMNVHLSRTVAAPMEPLLQIVPNDGSTTQLGGVQ